MNLRLPILFVFFPLALAPTAPAASAAPAGSDSKVAAVPPEHPEWALKQAMTPDAVRHVMGAPVSIQPMKTSEGKAEIWVYKRLVNNREERVEIGSIPVMETTVGADGKAHQEKTGETLQYANVHFATEETVNLLMFNDHFVMFKVNRREVKNYD